MASCAVDFEPGVGYRYTSRNRPVEAFTYLILTPSMLPGRPAAGPPTVPGAPVDLITNAGPRGGEISLSWSAPTDLGGAQLAGYRIYSSDVPWSLQLESEVGRDATSYVDADLGPGTTRHYAVSAVTRVGEGPRTETVGGWTFALPESTAVLALPGGGQLTLIWGAVPDGETPIIDYVIYAGDSASSLEPIATVPADMTTFAEAGLAPGTTRYYSVGARNLAGEGPRSDVAFMTTLDVPAPPAAGAANPGPAPGEITLTWSEPPYAGTPVTAYTVYGGDDPLSLQPIASIDPATTSFTDSGLGRAETRFYAVTASNIVGEGAPTPTLSARTFEVSGAPGDIAATAGPKPGEITVSWSPPTSDGGTPVTGYLVYSAAAGAAPLTPLTAVARTDILYAHSGLEPGATRVYAVAARNAAGESLPSASAFATVWSPPSAPTFTGAGPGPGLGEITLSWASVTDDGGTPITGYLVYAGDDTASPEPVAVLDATAASFTEAGLGLGVARSYVVSAFNAAGESERSPTIGAGTFDVPNAPQHPQATAGPAAGEVTLAWAAPDIDGGLPVTGYAIHAGADVSTLETVGVVDPESRSFVATNLPAGATLVFGVTAVNAAGEGPFSPLVPATVWAPPAAPTAVSASAGPSAGQITLTWATPTDDGGAAITGYRVVAGDTPATLTPFATLDASTLYVTESTLASGTTRFYSIAALNAAGEGNPSTVVSATTFAPPGAPQNVEATAGPAGGAITVAWSAPADDGGTAVTGYVVSGGDRPSDLAVLATVDPATTTFAEASLGNSRLRFYQVAAVNEAGVSSGNPVVSASTYAVPSAPRSLTATPGSASGQIVLSWLPPSQPGSPAVSTYRLYRREGKLPFTLVATLPGDRTTAVDTGLKAGRSYTYAVAATNPAGEGPLSNLAAAKAPSGPSKPSGGK
ncbi:MAG: fibronectin type III domain-containing protein [Acidimicrobiia bacterium]